MGKRQRRASQPDGRRQRPGRSRQPPSSEGSNGAAQEALPQSSDPEVTVLQQAAEQVGSGHRPDSGNLAEVYDDQAAHNATLTESLGTRGGELDAFVTHWTEHQARYDAVAAQVDLPGELIAALHWRESSGDFGTYLHQGDPLGKAAVNHPTDIPVFDDWESAAVHALGLKSGNQAALSITQETDDAAALGTYAEAYNGLGYHLYHSDTPSPYVYAGTSAYSEGKYVGDGDWDASHVDQQLGVNVMMDAVGGIDLGLVEDGAAGSSAVASAPAADTEPAAPAAEAPSGARQRGRGGFGRRRR